MSDLPSRISTASRLKGVFRLRSGATSTEYFDKYRFESEPALLREICGALASRLPASTEILAGLELGGVPIATVMSQLTGIPAVFVRKERKSYGTCQFVEGNEVGGRRVVVIEDIVTTGGQLIKSIEDLRAEGALIGVAMCVIDREAGGAAHLVEAGVELRALFQMSELT